ncbi:hypothetical protein B296_00011022 [Ensete ventricosum]|uniref:DUF834 domain-containing protein n=1 Tax=Ensete ventricosum TaxID=4639 RepID=A0A426ZMX3_ENSVE|nr:hypothetical protein B296_00011022 [Ensete ventricosum]
MRLSASTSNGEEMKMGANTSTWLGGSNRIRLQDDGGGSWAALEMKGGWAATFGYATGKQQGPTSSGEAEGNGSGIDSRVMAGWERLRQQACEVTIEEAGDEKGVVGDRFGERREMAGAAAKKATTLGATAIDKEEGSSGGYGSRRWGGEGRWQGQWPRRQHHWGVATIDVGAVAKKVAQLTQRGRAPATAKPLVGVATHGQASCGQGSLQGGGWIPASGRTQGQQLPTGTTTCSAVPAGVADCRTPTRVIAPWQGGYRWARPATA